MIKPLVRIITNALKKNNKVAIGDVDIILSVGYMVQHIRLDNNFK